MMLFSNKENANDVQVSKTGRLVEADTMSFYHLCDVEISVCHVLFYYF
jgi:hypothetical protein